MYKLLNHLGPQKVSQTSFKLKANSRNKTSSLTCIQVSNLIAYMMETYAISIVKHCFDTIVTATKALCNNYDDLF